MLPAEQQQDADWEIKEDAETDWGHGQRPENRSIDDLLNRGLLLVDKPNGPTSNQISVWTKKLLNRDKTGHSGTLDPNVTGVLPIGLNRGTKILGPLSKADKEYVCIMELDDTVDNQTVRETGEELVGTVTQLPPETSAVKREERDRELYTLDVLEVTGDQVLFRIGCEHGFYVRTFCEQFGDALGTDGAMADLRRTMAGVFSDSDAYTLQDIVDEYEYWKNGGEHTLDEMLLPIEAGIRHLPKIMVKDSAVAALAHGADLGSGGITRLQHGITTNDLVAILTLKGELVATATALTHTNGMLAKEETVAELDRVYMQKDTYPKQW
jgi:H/ACA ribonucleoprotein complex subunit 4